MAVVAYPATFTNILFTLLQWSATVPQQMHLSFGHYRCGNDNSWSEIFNFTAINREDLDRSAQYLVYGDLGYDNAVSVPFLLDEIRNNDISAVLHVGDFAYDMHEKSGERADNFFNMIEPIAATRPYMGCPGNHEKTGNFSQYENRFTMIDSSSGNKNNFYYSYDVGPVHFISFSTEMYFYLEYGWEQVRYQYEWLKNDLVKANANRDKRPWIITMGHRPMYCSDLIEKDCTRDGSIVRTGMVFSHAFALEELFYENGVDMSFWGHEHCYERLWPVFDQQVYNGSTTEPYTDPKAPVHITTGAAGNREKLEPFHKKPYRPWSAVRHKDYGYAKMTVHNRTHITLEQFSAEKEGQLLDKFVLIKNHHGKYQSIN